MTQRSWIVLGVVAVLALVAGTTVLNRRWWVRRINRRWNIVRVNEAPDDLPGTWLPEVEKIEYREVDAAQHTLAELVELYRNGGGEGWTRA
jgi:hypothetical protein